MTAASEQGRERNAIWFVFGAVIIFSSLLAMFAEL
jgi:hypothetical protein